MTGLEAATAIAERVGGRAIEVPTAGRSEFIVTLADGRVPVLVREFAHTIGAYVAGGRSWTAKLDDSAFGAIAAEANAWSTSRPADALTLYELATATANALAKEFTEAWTVSFPGVDKPREAWLQGANAAAASVGVFDRRIVVWVDRAAREKTFGGRNALDFRDVFAAVRAQHTSYERNVEATKQVARAAYELARSLSAKLGQVTFLVAPDPRHDLVSTATLGCAGSHVEVTWKADAVWAHAGVSGKLGWDGELDEHAYEAIASAILRAGKTLTLDKLRPNRRYRVREAFQELQRGTVVRFDGFNDIDNHHGRYEFIDDSGARVSVAGDFSVPESNEFSATYRYLEPID